MAKIDLRADIKLATRTLEAIEQAVRERAGDGRRPHLGASLIGRPCDRALWYAFRWALPVEHEPRLLRLFARGQREEAALAELLRAAGVTVELLDPETGRQFSFAAGHFGGSMDGVCVGVPDAPKTWHVLEFKTHNAKSFKQLAAKGVCEAKPEHWAQMQCYMHWCGMTRALYVAVCKDDDQLHIERIDYDRQGAERLFERARRITLSANPPDGISDDPDYFVCKLCEYRDLCHGTRAPEVTCRTCCHATPERGGEWTCSRLGAMTLSVSDQKRGCQGHRVIPALIARWAEPVDADEDENWVRYRRIRDGREFVNGMPPDGVPSELLQEVADEVA
jgi:hypothetical protein